MLCEDDVASWFQDLKASRRARLMHQLIHMCHPLELRFIASCVEAACRNNYLMFRNSESQANNQTVLKTLSSPVNADMRKKLLIYLCLLSSSNRPCSRVMHEKIGDFEAIYQFCFEVQMKLSMHGTLTSAYEDTLEELILLYTIATLHPAFDFYEKQLYFAVFKRLDELLCYSQSSSVPRTSQQSPLNVQIKDDSRVPLNHPAVASNCSLCFSTSTCDHICKLRLLQRYPLNSERINVINVQWSNGKYSTLSASDGQLSTLHTRLEGIISQPSLLQYPHDTVYPSQIYNYLQHLQGLSATSGPRAQPVYEFFRQLADEQASKTAVVHSNTEANTVYRPILAPPADQFGNYVSSHQSAPEQLLTTTTTMSCNVPCLPRSTTMSEADTRCADALGQSVLPSMTAGTVTSGVMTARAHCYSDVHAPLSVSSDSSVGECGGAGADGGECALCSDMHAKLLRKMTACKQLRRHMPHLRSLSLSQLIACDTLRLRHIGLNETAVARVRQIVAGSSVSCSSALYQPPDLATGATWTADCETNGVTHTLDPPAPVNTPQLKESAGVTSLSDLSMCCQQQQQQQQPFSPAVARFATFPTQQAPFMAQVPINGSAVSMPKVDELVFVHACLPSSSAPPGGRETSQSPSVLAEDPPGAQPPPPPPSSHQLAGFMATPVTNTTALGFMTAMNISGAGECSSSNSGRLPAVFLPSTTVTATISAGDVSFFAALPPPPPSTTFVCRAGVPTRPPPLVLPSPLALQPPPAGSALLLCGDSAGGVMMCCNCGEPGHSARQCAQHSTVDAASYNFYRMHFNSSSAADS